MLNRAEMPGVEGDFGSTIGTAPQVTRLILIGQLQFLPFLTRARL